MYKYPVLLTVFALTAVGYLRSDEPELLAEAKTISSPVLPFKHYITGVGIVEPSSEDISIGTPVNRIVDQVLVKVGQEVKKGEPLLHLEHRDLDADLRIQQAAYEIAVARVKRLQSMPRPEDTASAEAALRSAEITFNQAKSQYAMTQGLRDSRAVSREEIDRRYFNYQEAQANWQKAKAAWEKIRAGTWKPDLEIAHLEALQAQSNVEKIKTDIERTIVRSPIDGKVLQVKVHEGEFPPADTFRSPLMIIGNIEQKHLLVSINQYDAPSFSPETSAVAFLRGTTSPEFSLEFVNLEPYLVNKQNLTRSITERVDTKVLQVTYRFKETVPQLFVGQQMDVYIETDSKSEK